MRDNIGKTYSYRIGKKQVCKEITDEFFQFGRRLYETKDLDTGEPGSALADEIDSRFFPKAGVVIKKGYKGETIRHKQRNY